MSETYKTYIIAEIGINHNGSLDLAKRLIDAAKEAGCDAVKFQKRTIEAVYTKEELEKPRQSPFGVTNGDLKRALEFDDTAYRAIDEYCRSLGIAWSASCWDAKSVHFIADFRPPWLKIPSALITNMELLDAYNMTGIPLIVSTGMSTWEEIDACMWRLAPYKDFKRPVYRMRDGNYPIADLTLLHCHSSYPSPLEEINLACINSFKERYPGVKVGYSSHTVSPWPCLMAVVYGAEVVEAHLTLDRTMFGTDQAASLEPAAFKKLVEEIRTFEKCKGDGVKRCWPSEESAKAKLRR
jgi:N-acetylneuraminate synthase